jgi:MoxR-like ATPase
VAAAVSAGLAGGVTGWQHAAMAVSGLSRAVTNSGARGRLLGRDGELEALTTFLAQEAGPVAALVLEGPAGVGKTTLWEYGVALGRELGLRVLVSRAR